MAFNTVTLTAAGLANITFDGDDDDGSVTLRAGGNRFLVIKPGGGHWEVSAPGSLSPSAGNLEIDGGHVVVHEE